MTAGAGPYTSSVSHAAQEVAAAPPHSGDEDGTHEQRRGERQAGLHAGPAGGVLGGDRQEGLGVVQRAVAHGAQQGQRPHERTRGRWRGGRQRRVMRAWGAQQPEAGSQPSLAFAGRPQSSPALHCTPGVRRCTVIRSG